MTKRQDHYHVLGATKDATEDEIKKCYRRLALKYHPDKHAHSEDDEKIAAEQKFKEINQAYSVLSDSTRRERYDVSGVDNSDDELDDPVEGAPEGEALTAEDVFSMFLGIPPGARVKRRHYSTPRPASFESASFTLLQLLPAVILAVLALYPPPTASADFEPTATPFRIGAEAPFVVERRTRSAGVAYHVRADFERVTTLDDEAVLRRVEEAVEVLARAGRPARRRGGRGRLDARQGVGGVQGVPPSSQALSASLSNSRSAWFSPRACAAMPPRKQGPCAGAWTRAPAWTCQR